MAKKAARQIVVLKNPKTGTLYYTRKNPTLMPDKMTANKYDKKSQKVELFTETKVKLG